MGQWFALFLPTKATQKELPLYSILPGLWRAVVFRPTLYLFRLALAHFAEPKAGIGTDPSRFPSPFQSNCRSRRWLARHRLYWQQPVLSAHHKRLNAAFGTIAAQFQATIFQILCQVRSLLQQIVNGLS